MTTKKKLKTQNFREKREKINILIKPSKCINVKLCMLYKINILYLYDDKNLIIVTIKMPSTNKHTKTIKCDKVKGFN